MLGRFAASGMGSRKERWKLWLLCFLSLGAVVLAVWQGYSFLLSRLQGDSLQRASLAGELNSLQQQVSQRISGTAVAVNLIAQSPSIKQFATNPEALSAELVRFFQVLIESNGDVYMVRFIDRNGQEKIRIDRTGDGLVVVADDQLQNKAGRYYFSETVKLSSGEFHFSPLDLNMEYGRVETPLRPTVRISTPLFSPSGGLRGVLVFNVATGWILDLYRALDQSIRQPIYLVNQDGYWLYGKPPDLLWGFMWGKDERLQNGYPTLWRVIQSTGPKAQASEHDQVVVSATRSMDVLPGAVSVNAPEEILWYAVIVQEKRSLEAIRTLLPALLIIAALVFFSWAWARGLAERRRAQEELVKADRLSSLGSLVAGISHELNTPIGSALTIASTLKERAEDVNAMLLDGQIRKSEIARFVGDAEEASRFMMVSLGRADELIGQFKQVAVDRTSEHRRRFLLDEFLREVLATIQHLFNGRNIRLEFRSAESATMATSVMMDSYPGPLGQVVINLVQNALRHGFAPEDSGEIRVCADRLSNTGRSSEEWVRIEVIDTGKGIPPECLDRIFEPFFTTRFGDGGSGLGLHVTREIVTGILGGTIRVCSATSAGSPNLTRFRVEIPVVSPIRSASSDRDEKGQNL